MKWVALWFLIGGNGMQLTVIPEKWFDTEAECAKFANSRVGMVELRIGDRVRFECRAYPFIKPKPGVPSDMDMKGPKP